MPIVVKSGGTKLLEPSEPVQACNRDCFTFALHEILGSLFSLIIIIIIIIIIAVIIIIITTIISSP
jgi:type III secretory pathway component EscU